MKVEYDIVQTKEIDISPELIASLILESGEDNLDLEELSDLVHLTIIDYLESIEVLEVGDINFKSDDELYEFYKDVYKIINENL